MKEKEGGGVEGRKRKEREREETTRRRQKYTDLFLALSQFVKSIQVKSHA
jgi:hypothetical protein